MSMQAVRTYDYAVEVPRLFRAESQSSRQVHLQIVQLHAGYIAMIH